MKLFIIKTNLMYLFFKNRKAGTAPGGLVWVHLRPMLQVVSTAFMMLFMNGGVALGQEPTTLNWADLIGSMKKIKPARFGEFHVVKLKGIDTSICKASITMQNVGLETEIPDALKKIFTGTDAFIESSGGENYLENLEIKSPPIRVRGDVLICEVTTAPREEGNGCQNTNFSFEIPVEGGGKVDFSVGPAVSFRGSQDDRFYLTTEDTTLQKLDNENCFRPSLVAFIHAYPRTVCFLPKSIREIFSLGLLFGVGTEFKRVEDINLYVGGSLIFGRKKKGYGKWWLEFS